MKTPISWRLLASCLLSAGLLTSVFFVTTPLAVRAQSGNTGDAPAAHVWSEAPFINTWLVSKLFDNDAANSGFDRAWIDETGAAPVAGDGNWAYFDDRLFSRNYDDYQDLFSYFHVKQNESIAAKVVYAHVYVFSPQAQDAQLRVGADNAFKAWLNGGEVAMSTQSSPTKGSSPTLGFDVPETRLNSGKDFVTTPVQLAAGWNRLLLKIANQENGRFGFYARLTGPQGQPLPDLQYSTGGGSGALAISTTAMPEAKTGLLPTGYREWPYVNTKVDIDKIHRTLDPEEAPLDTFVANRSLLMESSPFVLTAQGGTAPYSWNFVGGELPPGLKLEAGGAVNGTVAASATLRDYKFAVRVRDASGATAQKELTLTVRERPNKWYEEDRLGALIHAPELVPPNQLNEMVVLMKRQGYRLGMPISYNNGDFLFRWPMPLAKRRTAEDWVQRYKTALEANGIKFGMYMGNLNNADTPDFSVNQMILVIDDAMRRYKPKALWFDWSGIDATLVDSLYSVIKSHDPEALVILNGSIRGSSGDWDIIAFEGWNSWGDRSWQIWPVDIPWPKKHAPESWRLLVTPGFGASTGVTTDWQEMMRVQISLIGDGFIADIDHSPTITPQIPMPKLSDSGLMQMHMKMADWASPAGLPPLYPSYTSVNPGPLQAAYWGYNTINLKRDTIYLHMLKNPYGKRGMPSEDSITFGPVDGKVKSVIWMNRNKRLRFTQRSTSTDRNVTVGLNGVVADPIDTILKVELERPLVESTEPVQQPIPVGNLASFKPAQLLSTDGSRTLSPSARQFARSGVDGKMGTTAAGAWEYAWMYHVDLEQVYNVSRIVVHFAPTAYATHYNVFVSDNGTDWHTVAEVANNTRGDAHTHTFASRDVRYVRVQALKPDGPDQPGAQMSVAELQVFEK